MKRPLECQWFRVFAVSRPGLDVTILVNRERNRIRVRTYGAKSETSKPKSLTTTRAVSQRELQQLVGTGARLTDQFQRIVCAMVKPHENKKTV